LPFPKDSIEARLAYDIICFKSLAGICDRPFENGYNEWFARALDVVISQWFRLSRLAAPPDRLRNDSLVNQRIQLRVHSLSSMAQNDLGIDFRSGLRETWLR
jgi:hypothetical protein